MCLDQFPAQPPVAWSRDEELVVVTGVVIGRGRYLKPFDASTRSALAEEADAPVRHREFGADEADPLVGLSQDAAFSLSSLVADRLVSLL